MFPVKKHASAGEGKHTFCALKGYPYVPAWVPFQRRVNLINLSRAGQLLPFSGRTACFLRVFTLFSLLLRPFSTFYGFTRPWTQGAESTSLAASVIMDARSGGPLTQPTAPAVQNTTTRAETSKNTTKTREDTSFRRYLRTFSHPFCLPGRSSLSQGHNHTKPQESSRAQEIIYTVGFPILK